MILFALIFILGVIGGAIYLLNLDQPKIDRVRSWVKNNGSLIIAGTFLLVVGILIHIFNIQWTNLGFLAAVGGILIYFLYSLKKGKETNWWLIASLVIALGVGYFLFHGPIIKEGVIKEKPATLYEKAQEKGYARALLSEAKDQLWKSPLKLAPYVPSYQLIARGEFVGRGFSKDAKIKTGWMTPETVRKGDKIRYQFSKDAYLEVINSKGGKIRHEGPEQDLYFSTDFGQITFWASKGAEVYVELWGVR
ncbi:MAG: hypothetical protein V1892_02355 [bacterium]